MEPKRFTKGILAGYEMPKRYSLKEKREQHRAAAKADALKRKWIHPEKRKSKSIKAWRGGGCTPK